MYSHQQLLIIFVIQMGFTSLEKTKLRAVIRNDGVETEILKATLGDLYTFLSDQGLLKYTADYGIFPQNITER